MPKREQAFYMVKHAETIKDKQLIAREIALLKILEGKLTYRIPVLDKWDPEVYLYSYRKISGVTINTGFYWDLTDTQKICLAKDLALFAYELHVTIPAEFAHAIGFMVTTWPMSPAILQEYIPGMLDDKLLSFFGHFLEVYKYVLTKPYDPVFLHHDLHGGNIIVHKNTGRLHGIIDFEDAAIGDPHQEFRLLYEIDPHLMESTSFFYAQL